MQFADTPSFPLTIKYLARKPASRSLTSYLRLPNLIAAGKRILGLEDDSLEAFAKEADVWQTQPATLPTLSSTAAINRSGSFTKHHADESFTNYTQLCGSDRWMVNKIVSFPTEARFESEMASYDMPIYTKLIFSTLLGNFVATANEKDDVEIKIGDHVNGGIQIKGIGGIEVDRCKGATAERFRAVVMPAMGTITLSEGTKIDCIAQVEIGNVPDRVDGVSLNIERTNGKTLRLELFYDRGIYRVEVNHNGDKSEVTVLPQVSTLKNAHALPGLLSYVVKKRLV